MAYKRKPSDTLLNHLISPVNMEHKFFDENEPNIAADRMSSDTATGALLLMEGLTLEAAKYFYRAYRLRDDDFWAKFYLGGILLEGNDPANANYFFEACLEQAPLEWTARPHLLTNIADCQFKLGRYTDAEKTLEEVISKSPEIDVPYYMQAIHHAYQGNFQQALSDVQRGKEKIPESYLLKRMELDLLEQMKNKKTSKI